MVPVDPLAFLPLGLLTLLDAVFPLVFTCLGRQVRCFLLLSLVLFLGFSLFVASVRSVGGANWKDRHGFSRGHFAAEM